MCARAFCSNSTCKKNKKQRNFSLEELQRCSESPKQAYCKPLGFFAGKQSKTKVDRTKERKKKKKKRTRSLECDIQLNDSGGIFLRCRVAPSLCVSAHMCVLEKTEKEKRVTPGIFLFSLILSKFARRLRSKRDAAFEIFRESKGDAFPTSIFIDEPRRDISKQFDLTLKENFQRKFDILS